MAYPDRVRAFEVFRNETVEVDGFVFQACQFHECKIVFLGEGPVKFDECLFDRCQWVFNGPAENVLLYLSALYNGLGDGGESSLESIFESIRRGTIMQGIHPMQPALPR